MKKIIIGVLISFILSTMVFATPIGLLLTSVKEPITATSLDSYSKNGTSSAFGLLGLVAIGDGSIEAALQDGGIKAIHHVDKHYFALLGGLIVVEKTKVYGN